jgi:hypothetical protein
MSSLYNTLLLSRQCSILNKSSLKCDIQFGFLSPACHCGGMYSNPDQSVAAGREVVVGMLVPRRGFPLSASFQNCFIAQLFRPLPKVYNLRIWQHRSLNTPPLSLSLSLSLSLCLSLSLQAVPVIGIGLHTFLGLS